MRSWHRLWRSSPCSRGNCIDADAQGKSFGGSKEYLKGRWSDWVRAEAMIVRHALPLIGTKKLFDIQRADLTDIYYRLEHRPSVARAIHASLR